MDNSEMRIQIRVSARQAQAELRRLQKSVDEFERKARAMGANGASGLTTFNGIASVTKSQLAAINSALEVAARRGMGVLGEKAAMSAKHIERVNMGLRTTESQALRASSAAMKMKVGFDSLDFSRFQQLNRIAQPMQATKAALAAINAEMKRMQGLGAFDTTNQSARAARAQIKLVNKELDKFAGRVGTVKRLTDRQLFSLNSRIGKMRDTGQFAAMAKAARPTNFDDINKNLANFNKLVKLPVTHINGINKSLKTVAASGALGKQAQKAALFNKQLKQVNATLRNSRAAAIGSSMLGGGLPNLNGSLNALTSATTKTESIWHKWSRIINGPMASSKRGMLAFGKDLQWIGRQLNFNFTIPLLVAGGVATSWALESERAWTRLVKVYGDGTRDYTAELDKVKEGTRALSDLFGVPLEEVNMIAAEWAAAGATGVDLLEATKRNLEAVILGDYDDPTEAFKDLITIQGAYKLSTEELGTAVAYLNTVENETAVSFQDLTKGIAQAGGTAAVAGVPLEALAAHVAALVPVTGSAATAGNALKTIYSRLLDPTGEMIELMDELGIAYRDQSFQQLNVQERLELLAQTYDQLSDSEKGRIGSIFAGRRQINKYLVLMEALTDETSAYHKVLEDLSPENFEENINRANKEIQTLLDSDPRKLERVVNMLKNMLIDAVIPMIPFIIQMVSYIKSAFEWFQNLDPAIQKLIVGMVLLTISAGIVSQAFGSIILLVGTLLRPIIWLGGAISTKLIPAVFGLTKMTAAWKAGATAAGNAGLLAGIKTAAGAAIAAAPIAALVAAIVAAVVVMYVFRDKIMDFFDWLVENIPKMVTKIPEAFMWAMRAAYEVVVAMLRAIRDAFVNAFTGRKVSVEDTIEYSQDVVLNGGDQVRAQAAINRARDQADRASELQISTPDFQAWADEYYDELGDSLESSELVIPEPVITFQTSSSDFFAASRDIARAGDQAELRQQRELFLEVAPNAGASFDAWTSQITALRAESDRLEAAVDAQQERVDAAQDAYQDAADAATEFADSLEPLRRNVDELSDAISEAESEMDRLADTPLVGMRAMSDAIFENEMAQKRLRLEILKLGEAGETYEELQDRIADLNGDIEMLRGKITDLRQGGAGSDILAVYEKELDALEEQRDALRASGESVNDLEKQLEELQRQGEILDLEESLAFDELTRQIEQLIDSTEEMTFDEIVAGIKEQKKLLDELQPRYEAASAELEDQEEILQDLEDARDALNKTYEAERDQLEQTQELYDDVEKSLGDLEDALEAALSGREKLLSEAQDAIDAADFTDDISLPTFDGDSSLDSIDEWLAEVQGSIDEGFGEIDIFGGIKEAMDEAWETFKTWVGETFTAENLLNLFTGFIAGWTELLISWYTLPHRLIIGLGTELWNAAWSAMGSLWSGFTAGWANVSAWLGNIPQWILNLLETGGGWVITMAKIGRDIMSGIKNGLWAGMGAVFSFFWALPGNIWNYVKGLNWGNTLYAVGAGLLSGLWDGLRWAWGLIAGWWNSTIGGWGFDLPIDIPTPWGKIKSISVPDLPGLPDKFFVFKHEGGLVEGAGEVPVMALAGEMVLTQEQQAQLLEVVVQLEGEGSTNTTSSSSISTSQQNLLFDIANGIELPKFHTGGMVPGDGEVPALLLAGEMVLTQEQQANVGRALSATSSEELFERIRRNDLNESTVESVRSVTDEVEKFHTGGIAGGRGGSFGATESRDTSTVVSAVFESIVRELRTDATFSQAIAELQATSNELSSISSTMTRLESTTTFVDREGGSFPSSDRVSSSTTIHNDNSKTININGDLSFPNITDPNDASKFIDNLVLVAN